MTMAMMRRRSGREPGLRTSLIALFASSAALLLTLLNTSLRTTPCASSSPWPTSSWTSVHCGSDRAAADGGLGQQHHAAASGGVGAAADSGFGRRASAADDGGAAPLRTLSFQVCNGFANQRLALAYGLAIARRLGRAAVLPDLLLDGTQLSDRDALAADGRATAPFEGFYDAGALREAARAHGLRVLTREEHAALAPDAGDSGADGAANPAATARVSLAAMRPISDAAWALRAHRAARHLELDCPLFKLSPSAVHAERALVWDVLSALRPAPALEARVRRALARATGGGGGSGSMGSMGSFDSIVGSGSSGDAGSSSGSSTAAAGGAAGFNFVHARLERDWQAHCARWAALSAADGLVRDNCWNGTLDLAGVLADRGFARGGAVYLAAHWAGADPSVARAVLGGLAAAGFARVVRSAAAGDAGSLGAADRDGEGSRLAADAADSADADPLAGLPREARALVEFELVLRADRFLGNSVSTFSALAILQRRRQGRWAGYYNGGDIPLARVLPLFDLPWVFTFNSWSAAYEPMMRAAVSSALRVGGLAPHCVFAGDAARSPAAAWLRSHGVRVIPHDPEWRSALAARAAGRAAANLAQSHLFASEDAVVGTWQRIDVPVVPWLDQFTYALFTDTDVLFRRAVALRDFPRPLPSAVGMGPEMLDVFPYNAGVMLLHLPRLRATYGALLAFVLANEEGLTFPGYGPGDQGAYNAFYEAEVRAWRLPPGLNAKPYRADSPARASDAAIVHFHGPKPADYLEYAQSGRCARFGGMCRAGLAARACGFVREWARRLGGEEGAAALAAWRAGACGARAAGEEADVVLAAAAPAVPAVAAAPPPPAAVVVAVV